MSRENHRVFLCKRAYQFANLAYLVGIQTVGRFIQYQQIRIAQKRIRQTNSLPVALG